MSKTTFAIGGVHPHDNKLARDCRTEVLPPAPTMYISVAQHLGAPALPVVEVGDKVKVGQVIAGPASPSAPAPTWPAVPSPTSRSPWKATSGWRASTCQIT